ncbi:trypsin-like peptidase domain-containing protein [Defluviitalea phaphyphila]|uniref:trypsin-like peptidase domain-containing protein n=1 Tax=Defluviitalea phaphyphila TaxID=1473580 RepID=UPI00072FB61F|nr:trypsin-like peptidase domain-containing protein [Defluviitalea phaphyphila]
MNHIFISHALEDSPIAEALYEELEKKGLKCWMPSKNILAGQNYGEAIFNAIEKCSVIVIIFSSNSNSSQKIIRELQKAIDANKRIISFKIENINPSKDMEYYLTNAYNLDATNDTLFISIDKLETIINNTIDISNQVNNSNEVNNNINKYKNVNMQNQIYKINKPNNNKINPANSRKKNPLKAIIFGISILVCFFIFMILLSDTETLTPSNNESIDASVSDHTSVSEENNNITNISFEYEKADNISSTKFTEEDIIKFAKTAVMELDRLDGSPEFYEQYAYNGPEYNIMNLYEDVMFANLKIEIREFQTVELIGKNKKPFGIEYLVKMDFTCYANYDINIDGEIKHREGEATLYNNLVIIETNDGELKYLVMDGISEEDLEKRNNSIEVTYNELQSIEDLDTEDTVQSFIPSNTITEEEALKSVKEIVQENDHKIVAVFVETNQGTAQGSGFFIEDGIIVTNYHVIDGGNEAYILLSDESTIDVDGIICADPYLDIAVLKLKKQIGIEPVVLGGIEDVEKGEVAVAIGSPLGLFNTVSTGIISNTWNNEGIYLLQISIPITHGNSGGALFDETGKVVGITTAGMGEADLNFAVSTEHLKDIANQINAIDFYDLPVYTFAEVKQLINDSNSNLSSSDTNIIEKEPSTDEKEIKENEGKIENTSPQHNYRFVHSNQGIGKNLTFTTDIERIEELDIYYTVEYAENDADIHLSNIIGTVSLPDYKDFYQDPLNLFSDFDITFVEEDLDYYMALNQDILASDAFIDYEVDNIKLIELAFNKYGKIDGIVVEADIIKFVDFEEYDIKRNKYYFRYNELMDRFLYVGEIE